MVTPEERLRLGQKSKWKTALAVIASLPFNAMTGQATDVPMLVLGWLGWLGCLVIFIWGCSDLARSKGYPWQAGFIGLVWIFGYLILYCMHDRWLAEKHKPKTTSVEDSGYVRDPTRL